MPTCPHCGSDLGVLSAYILSKCPYCGKPYDLERTGERRFKRSRGLRNSVYRGTITVRE